MLFNLNIFKHEVGSFILNFFTWYIKLNKKQQNIIENIFKPNESLSK